MNLQITAPLGGTFDVVIKNSVGTTVYSATHGNEVFDPAITTAGDYEMFIDGAETPVHCFTISACECPPFLQAFISTPNDVFFYFNIEFDLSGWTFCPFFIYVESIGYFSATYAINTLADLTFVSSDLGRKTTLIGGRTDIYYVVTLMDDTSGTPCVEGYVSSECVSPPLPLTLTGNLVDGVYSVDIDYTVCGDNTCNTMVWNYLQTSPAGGSVTPDSGTFTDTIDCGALPYTSNHVLTPDFGILDPSTIPLIYIFSATDCCGNTYNFPTYLRLRVTFPLAP
jgi:hypothetical protein